MKLVIAIIHRDDANAVSHALSKKGYSSTRLSTTGGFLMAGNVTLLIGVEEQQVDQVLGTVQEYCHSRTQLIPAMPEFSYGFLPGAPVEVTMGGATVFVIDVERFERI